MSQQWWWYLSRATGIVATVLAVAALVFGFFFSARNTGERRRANWWLDLHNWLGGLALIFTIAHLVTVFFDSNSGIGLVQLLIPGTAHAGQWGITWGVVATYLFTLTVFTSWPSKRFSQRVWRAVHLTSVFGVALAGLHAFQSGSDATERAFQIGLIAVATFFLYATSLRLLALALRRRKADPEPG